MGVILGSTCIWYGGPGKHAIPLKYLNICNNLFLECNELGYHSFAVGDFRLFLRNMHTDLGLGLFWMDYTTCNKAGSG